MPDAPPRDLLDILIAARDTLSREEIRDELFIFFLAGTLHVRKTVSVADQFAGHETTATTLTWTIQELFLHPEVKERVREEVRTHGLYCGCANFPVLLLSTLSCAMKSVPLV